MSCRSHVGVRTREVGRAPDYGGLSWLCRHTREKRRHKKIFLTPFLGSLDAQRRAPDTLHMSSDATQTAMTAPSGDIATVTTPASLAEAQEAIPRLPDHLVVAHILRSEYFDDPANLARLPAVSRVMRDAVTATGLRFEELCEIGAVELGCLSAVQRLQR